MSTTAIRLLALATMALWGGSTLLLSQLRWFRRVPLVRRVRPYLPGAPSATGRSHLGSPSLAGQTATTELTTAAVRSLLLPLAKEAGERLGVLLGAGEDVDTRLRRIHASHDVADVRLRQLGVGAAALAGSAVLAAVASLPAPLALAALVVAPLGGFLLEEHRLTLASESWRRRILLELPVVAEQLGMLLGAGFSLGGALARVAERGHGACAQDLRRVVARIGHGLDDVEALREWAELARVDAVDRLVAVLSLNREAGDLGALIAEEARAIRRETQRQTVERIERQAEQVWIPVTVATLLPGVVFLAVPFIDAMQLFSAS